MKILRARLYEAERERAAAEASAARLVADRQRRARRRRSARTTSRRTASPTTASGSRCTTWTRVLAGDLDQFSEALAAEEKRQKLAAAAAGEDARRGAAALDRVPRAERQPHRRASTRSSCSVMPSTSAGSSSTPSFERPLDDDELAACRELIARRARREPVAYILGRWGFHGLDLAVDPRVLVPRPETELVVDRCLALLDGVAGPRPRRRHRLGGDRAGAGVGAGRVEVCGATCRPTRSRSRGANGATARGWPSSWVAVRSGRRARRAAGSSSSPRTRPTSPRPSMEALEPEVRDCEPRGATVGGDTGLEVIERLVAAAPGTLSPGWRARARGRRRPGGCGPGDDGGGRPRRSRGSTGTTPASSASSGRRATSRGRARHRSRASRRPA